MTDILKAFALTCGVLLLASLAYVLIVFGLAYVSAANPNLMWNSPDTPDTRTQCKVGAGSNFAAFAKFRACPRFAPWT